MQTASLHDSLSHQELEFGWKNKYSTPLDGMKYCFSALLGSSSRCVPGSIMALLMGVPFKGSCSLKNAQELVDGILDLL